MNKSFIYQARLLTAWVASSRLYSRLAAPFFSQIDRVILLHGLIISARQLGQKRVDHVEQSLIARLLVCS